MSATSATVGEVCPPGPEGRDWVGLLLDDGLLEAALDGLGEGRARPVAPNAPRPARSETPLGRLLRLAGFRGAGAGGGGPGPHRAGAAWA